MKRYLPLAALLVAACATEPAQDIYEVETANVYAAFETDPMPTRGDTADDPALWVNPLDASKSLILGTNKDEGLYVYDLTGKKTQFVDTGRINNVDVRGNIAVASNDETKSVSWFSIDPATQTVTHIGDTPTLKDEPYGICAGLIDGNFLAIPTYKDGTIQIWSLPYAEAEGLNAELVRTYKFDSQLEGCVVEDDGRQVFVGEEEHGIWKLDLVNDESIALSVDTIAARQGLVADVEGISIWKGEEGYGYLVASAQAADRYVIYDLEPPHARVGVITIVASPDGSVDGVTHTDGLDVNSTPLPGFPKGVMIVQDDANPESEVDQNFKIIDWADIEAAARLNDRP